jgi:hypothetical protein
VKRTDGPWKAHPYREPQPVPEPKPLPPDERDAFEKINDNVCRRYQDTGKLPTRVYIDIDLWKQLMKEIHRTSMYTTVPPPPPGASKLMVGTAAGQVEVEPHPAIKKDHILLVEE